MTEEMFIISVCQEFKWDYFTYMKQPDWFIEIIKIKMQIDSENIRRANKQNYG